MKKILILVFGAYFGSLLVAAILLFLTAAVSSGRGPGGTGNALLMMLAADAVLFLLTTLGVFLGLKPLMPSLPLRILVTLGYGLGLALSGLMIAIFSAVFLNR